MVDLINAIGTGILYTGITIMSVTVVVGITAIAYVWIKDIIDEKKED